MQVANSDVFIEETVDCNGSDSTVIANEYCLVQISTFLAEPYNYDGGDSVYAKVSAVNIYGESNQSEKGNDAYLTEVPDAPLNVAENNLVRTSTENGLTWSDGLLDGGAEVIDYRIKMQVLGSGSYSTIALAVTT